MAPPLPPPDSLDELSSRIDLIELRVVRRDLEFRHHWQSLQHRGQAVLTPARWLLPLVGGGSGWLFWRLFRRRPRPAPQAPHPHAGPFARGAAPHHAASPSAARATAGGGASTGSPGSEARPEVKMLQTLTVLWSLAPDAWRSRLGPETTQLLLGVVAGLLHGRRRPLASSSAQDGTAGQGTDRASADARSPARSDGPINRDKANPA